jgi:hypothetical protein
VTVVRVGWPIVVRAGPAALAGGSRSMRLDWQAGRSCACGRSARTAPQPGYHLPDSVALPGSSLAGSQAERDRV